MKIISIKGFPEKDSLGQQSLGDKLDLDDSNHIKSIKESLDSLMVEDPLTYIRLVNYCHDSYNPRNFLDEETSSKLTKRGLMRASWVVPSVVRNVVIATTSVI